MEILLRSWITSMQDIPRQIYPIKSKMGLSVLRTTRLVLIQWQTRKWRLVSLSMLPSIIMVAVHLTRVVFLVEVTQVWVAVISWLSHRNAQHPSSISLSNSSHRHNFSIYQRQRERIQRVKILSKIQKTYKVRFKESIQRSPFYRTTCLTRLNNKFGLDLKLIQYVQKEIRLVKTL